MKGTLRLSRKSYRLYEKRDNFIPPLFGEHSA